LRRSLTAPQVAQAFHDACLAELDALKPGNVHRFGEDAGIDAAHIDPRISVADFEQSARVSAPSIAGSGLSVGGRIRRSVEATKAAVGQNTNLGIILLASPLAAAALDDAAGGLRERLAQVLAGLSVEDARDAYAAIRDAVPGGLGEVPQHDVASEPNVTLLEAMRTAEGYDRIAWNYTHEYADIFDLGLPRLASAIDSWQSLPFATSFVYLGFLGTIPDTLIERKFGNPQAVQVMQEASWLEARLAESSSPQALVPLLTAFDHSLKARGLNPGTSADLTVVTLFAASLLALEEPR
jgi:triphosphoribosyl-dephospho-CoA synthase